MNLTPDPAVSVIIAAYNAQATIGSSVRSALSQHEVRELIVVDDVSQDATIEVAKAAAQGDDRLIVLRQETNRGPAAARNRAILAASSPYIAILDSDDGFVPGRFRRIFETNDWEFCADNILFSDEPSDLEGPDESLTASRRVATLDLATFVTQNRSGSRGNRRELGFLKPVIRRAFLIENGLLYDEQCRLGEDFLLYAHALAKGARFRILEACGYTALERGNSLSGNHRIEDLVALLEGIDDFRRNHELDAPVAAAFTSLHRSTREKIVFREILQLRREKGVLAGGLALMRSRSAIRDLIADKLRRFEPDRPVKGRLFSPDEFAATFA